MSALYVAANSSLPSSLPSAVTLPVAGVSQVRTPAVSSSDTNKSAAGAGQNLSASSLNNPKDGASSAFLTQLFSQSESQQEDNQIVLADSFAHFLPAPQYNEFLSYGVVKFRPSNAGLDLAGRNLPQPSANESAVPANDYRAYRQTQSRAASNAVRSTKPEVLLAG